MGGVIRGMFGDVCGHVGGRTRSVCDCHTVTLTVSE